jgi:Flp pilus assembly protein TadB
MTIFIGFAVLVALVVALLLWRSHRTYKPGGARHDVAGAARKSKLQSKEKSAKWSAGM